uniref:Uncharacterized protein n=1 Tax=Rhizophora mucronata TaxID=61149 RepID=A0A2P2Q7G9_RHIMU
MFTSVEAVSRLLSNFVFDKVLFWL